jgi:hypothetical protein
VASTTRCGFAVLPGARFSIHSPGISSSLSDNNEFDGLEAFAFDYVVAVADADQPLSVLGEQLPGSGVARFAYGADIHGPSLALFF